MWIFHLQLHGLLESSVKRGLYGLEGSEDARGCLIIIGEIYCESQRHEDFCKENNETRKH